MARIGENVGVGQMRTPSRINQYSTEEAFVREGLRPDLGPSDLIPMGIQTSWVNPGEKVLLKDGEILPLTPLGPASTDVYPRVMPAPADTTNTDFEDRLPRIQVRGDQIYRSRSGDRGPGQYWKYGGTQWGMENRASGGIIAGLGQPESEPVMFYDDPYMVAYQTYPGPFLGQEAATVDMKSEVKGSLLVMLVGAGIAAGGFFVENEKWRIALLALGGVTAGMGLSRLIRSAV